MVQRMAYEDGEVGQEEKRARTALTAAHDARFSSALGFELAQGNCHAREETLSNRINTKSLVSSGSNVRRNRKKEYCISCLWPDPLCFIFWEYGKCHPSDRTLESAKWKTYCNPRVMNIASRVLCLQSASISYNLPIFQSRNLSRIPYLLLALVPSSVSTSIFTVHFLSGSRAAEERRVKTRH